MFAPLRPIDSSIENDLDNLHPQALRSVYWEIAPDIAVNIAAMGHSRLEKEAWFFARFADYGQCGVTLSFPTGARATVLYCAPHDAPRAQTLESGPVSDDAQIITSLFIDPQLRSQGMEAVLLDAAVMNLTHRGFPAVEAFGVYEGAEVESFDRHGRAGIMRAEELMSAGFELVRDHPVMPRLRLELPPASDILSAAEAESLLRSAEMAHAR
ncbi:hypothetical protein [Corynebacterium tapiri]|uniref:GNAT family N-acetyltransferase n=1 Tax=Corynebacterium tapiri TaxID=1448266 RepID=A0A5C4U3U2_9CORY|nr:hypothetical protein [Corynebacterium tapiri]TNL96862.1 hypothetical protein FHE74_07555 [Corynebacterium tapiri]